MSKIIIDIGGGSLKIGKLGQKYPRSCVHNCIAKQKGKVLVGGDIDQAKHFTGLKFSRPIEKGALIDLELQEQILTHVIDNEPTLKMIDRNTSSVIITKPPFNPKVLEEDLAELMFEKFNFFRLSLLSTAFCNAIGMAKEISTTQPVSQLSSALIVDSGFSYTYITPIICHMKQKKSIRRIDVGGKLLTNQLKEVLSLRYYDLRDETYIVNFIKESLCYISLDFLKELKSKEKIMTRYVLPDYINSRVGYEKKSFERIEKGEQFIPLSTERISVPEVLFNPSDVGLNQAGIPETIFQSVESLTLERNKSLMYDSIVVCGGNSLFNNFSNRIENDLRSLVDSKFNIRVFVPSNPIFNCWKGAQSFAQQSELSKFTVSKPEFEEYGHNVCIERFVL